MKMRLFSAERGKSKKSLIFGAILPFAFFGLLASLNAALFSGCSDPTKGEAEIEFWSVYDDSDVFVPLIKEFNKTYKKIKINYHKKTPGTYEEELINALAAGRGPDIFAIHNTWLARHIDKLEPMDEETMTIKEYQETFVDVAAQDFIGSPLSNDTQVILPQKIYAVPLYVDTLGLYWNKDIFNAEGISQPPKDWNEFSQIVEKLIKKDESSNILRAGATIGAAANINRAQDVLSLLMLQTGTKMVDDQKQTAVFDGTVMSGGEVYQPGKSSLEFYTSFSNPLKKIYTWNNKMDYSIDAFSQGKAAMMINYAYHISTIKAKDPHLNFAVAAAPQPQNPKVIVNFANYWGLSVWAGSTENNKKYAWIFLKWLSEKPQEQKYLEASQRPASRRDLIPWQKDDLMLGVFAEQSLTARSWYQINNVSIDAIFSEMIDSVVEGRNNISDALAQAAKEVTLLMKR